MLEKEQKEETQQTQHDTTDAHNRATNALATIS
jgi:hypothetical protein